MIENNEIISYDTLVNLVHRIVGICEENICNMEIYYYLPIPEGQNNGEFINDIQRIKLTKDNYFTYIKCNSSIDNYGIKDTKVYYLTILITKNKNKEINWILLQRNAFSNIGIGNNISKSKYSKEIVSYSDEIDLIIDKFGFL